MNYRFVLFDLDGTLLDTLGDLADATNASLRMMGLPEFSLDGVRRRIGHGNWNLIKSSMPEGTADSDIEKAFIFFKQYYADHCDVKTMPYDGVDKVLEGLAGAGVRFGIVSNKLDFLVKKLRDRFFPDMEYASGGREGVPLKPDPAMIEDAMRYFGAERPETLYVGDGEGDIETSRRAGIDCLCSLWGFRSREELEKAGGELFAETPGDILKTVL